MTREMNIILIKDFRRFNVALFYTQCGKNIVLNACVIHIFLMLEYSGKLFSFFI